MRMKSALAAAVCAVVFGAVGATGALAGEVKGPPTGGTASVDNNTGAPLHANSICAFSGLNDFRGGPTNKTQTPANQGSPGDPGSTCLGGGNPENPTGNGPLG